MSGVQTRPAVLSRRRLWVPESLCWPSHARWTGFPSRVAGSQVREAACCCVCRCVWKYMGVSNVTPTALSRVPDLLRSMKPHLLQRFI